MVEQLSQEQVFIALWGTNYPDHPVYDEMWVKPKAAGRAECLIMIDLREMLAFQQEQKKPPRKKIRTWKW